jgi:Icc-related predicted phosphoesterase
MLLGFCVAGCLGVAGACMRFSPFEVGLDDDQTNQTARNLAKLAAAPAPAPGETFSFGFLSDTHDGYNEAGTIRGLLDARPEVRFIVHAGDLTDFGSHQEYVWFHDETADGRVPIFVAVGNHDGLTNGRKLYESMFGADNFTFRFGSSKLVFFNTNTIEYKAAEPDLAWLEREVNDHAENEGVFVVTHHPPNSEPHLTPEVQARYRQIHRDAKVLANLHGHIHQEYVVEQDGPTTYLRVKAALDGAFAIVTTNGRSLSWERCDTSGCQPAEVLVP